MQFVKNHDSSIIAESLNKKSIIINSKATTSGYCVTNVPKTQEILYLHESNRVLLWNKTLQLDIYVGYEIASGINRGPSSILHG